MGEQLAEGLPTEPGSWEGTCWPCPSQHAPPPQGHRGSELRLGVGVVRTKEERWAEVGKMEAQRC